VVEACNDMISRNKIHGSYMPAGEAPDTSRFLYWLLAGAGENLTAASSEAVAVCEILSSMAFDTLVDQA